MSVTQENEVPETASPRTRPHWLVFVSLALSAGLLVGLTVTALRAAGDSTTPSEPVRIELGDLFIKPQAVTVLAGEEITLEVTNSGKMRHNVAVDPGKPLWVEPGGTGTLRLGPLSESTKAWCTVPGHRESGMALAINVEN